MAVLGNGTARAQSPLKSIIQDVGIDQRLDAQVPLELEFRDEAGRRVRLGKYFDRRPVVLLLVYYRCPMLCNQVLNGFLKSSQALKFRIDADYEVVTVSFDPGETPRLAAEKKERYVGAYRRPGAAEGWHFLTGDEPSIERLARSVGFRYRRDAASGQFAHASGIMVLTPDGKVSKYFYGIEYPPEDLRLGLVESSAGRIGGLVDRVLLLCYHYDPSTGKYGLAIAGALRVAGSATVLAMGGFLFMMFRQERRRSRLVRQDGRSAADVDDRI
ncbi:MAG: SCO family protein [Pirellulales bacterium]